MACVDLDTYLTTSETAAILGVSEHTVTQLIADRELPAVRRSTGVLRVRKRVLDAYVRRVDVGEVPRPYAD